MNKPSSKNNQSDSDTEEYTQEEIKKLDYYQDYSNHLLDDDEIYDLMCKYKDDDEKIKEELDELIKIANKGEEYQWHEVCKSKNIFL
jgi:hypothetical protein